MRGLKLLPASQGPSWAAPTHPDTAVSPSQGPGELRPSPSRPLRAGLLCLPKERPSPHPVWPFPLPGILFLAFSFKTQQQCHLFW